MIRKSKEEGKKDFFTVIMIVQTVLSALLISAILLSFNGKHRFLDVMLEAYNSLMLIDFTKDDAKETLYGLFAEASETAEKIRKNDKTADSEDKSVSDTVSVAAGGKDILFTSLETLEGISFENIQTGVSMRIPLEDYVVTSDFGYRYGPVTGEPGIHTGIDMAADYGAPIFAAAEGIVVDSAWDSSYGNYIKILHKNNTVSIYAHCSSLCAEEGETVLSGEKIAEVGSTGASTGNHLHFEVRKDNIRINPENLFDEEIKT